MNRGDRATALHKKGYNCCQSVILSFADTLDLPEEDLAKIGAGFLGGMATFGGTCGALAGAQIVNGLREYRGKQIPEAAKALYQEFEKRCGATVCGDIKGKKTGKVLCACDDCIRNAAAILEERYA